VKPIVETDHALPLVHVGFSTLVGAVADPPGKEGLARLTTRLTRRTAHGLDANLVDEQLDALGSSLGADVSYSTAGFSGSVLRRSVKQYVDLLRGVLLLPGFSADEFERLKRETLAEIVEYRDDDRALARMWFRKSLFEGHPYGRGVTGTTRSISAVTLDDVRAAYEQNFLKGSWSAAFAGDIEAEEAERIAEVLTPKGANLRERLPPPAPARFAAESRLVIVDKPERTQTQILIGCSGTRADDPDHTALTVANTVFGGTFTARLTQEVRAKRGWSYGAYSSLPIDRQRQAFSMWTFPAAADAAPCIELQLGLLRDWVERGITEEELDWVKHYLIRSHVFSTDTAVRRMSLRQDEVVLELPQGYHTDFPARVQAVTVEAANAAIRQRITPDQLLIVVLGTEADVGDAVRAAMPAGTKMSTVRYDEE
jgi:zinc protease